MKRVIALLLALFLMCGLLAACSNGEETPSGDPSTTPDSNPSTLPSYEAQGDDEPTNEIELPLVEDTYTFDYWIALGATFEDFSGTADNIFYQWMEEQTNVHMNFIHPPAAGINEAFQTMILSSDLPDFINGIKRYYTGGMDKGIADGVILRLNEYVDQYMPNYRKEVYRDAETFQLCVTDEGNQWGIQCIYKSPATAAYGLGVRTDWLEQAGMTVEDAETIDGLEKVLTAFKDYTYENQGPLYLAQGSLTYATGLNAGYNITSPALNNNGVINKDGVATWSVTEPGMKEYIAKMADWQKKGLINMSYIADSSTFSPPQDRWVNSEIGVGEFVYTNVPMFAAAAAVSEVMPDPDFDLDALTSPKVTADQDWATDIHTRMVFPGVLASASMAFTTQCSDIELACRYWDYVWTDEGKQAANWGPYVGELGDTNATYYVDETDANKDGLKECYQPWLMEKLNNVSHVQTYVCVFNGPAYYIWEREWCALSEKEIDYTRVWSRAGGDWWWPDAVSLSADEGEIVARVMTDCVSLFNEWAVEVITGEKSVDTYDTELIPALEAMNYQEALDCYQAALDRYNERIKFMEE